MSWLAGDALKKLEERGVVIRFVIGRRFFQKLKRTDFFFVLIIICDWLILYFILRDIKFFNPVFLEIFVCFFFFFIWFWLSFIPWKICSANRGDSLDRNIDDENRLTQDFLILVSYPIFTENAINYFLFFCVRAYFFFACPCGG